jgi:hypothetical protein
MGPTTQSHARLPILPVTPTHGAHRSGLSSPPQPNRELRARGYRILRSIPLLLNPAKPYSFVAGIPHQSHAIPPVSTICFPSPRSPSRNGVHRSPRNPLRDRVPRSCIGCPNSRAPVSVLPSSSSTTGRFPCSQRSPSQPEEILTGRQNRNARGVPLAIKT